MDYYKKYIKYKAKYFHLKSNDLRLVNQQKLISQMIMKTELLILICQIDYLIHMNLRVLFLV